LKKHSTEKKLQQSGKNGAGFKEWKTFIQGKYKINWGSPIKGVRKKERDPKKNHRTLRKNREERHSIKQSRKMLYSDVKPGGRS